MKFVAIVSGDNSRLGAEELKQLSDAKAYSLSSQVVTLEGSKFIYSDLAYTKKLYELLFTTTKRKLKDDVKSFNFDKHYSGSFRVDRYSLDLDLKYLGSLVWKQLKKPKVDLKNPNTEFGFIADKNKIYVAKLIFRNMEKFTERRPHLRPGFHPSSLQPKLARALVNLAKVKRGETIADPFCGTGGILIEAGLLGYRVVASDLSESMVELCRRNFRHFKVKSEPFVANATEVKLQADAIVTDPPYGICAALYKSDRLKLYKKFLANAYRNLRKGSRLVIMFPNRIRETGKFRLVTELDHYQHHSLTRHILVLEKT